MSGDGQSVNIHSVLTRNMEMLCVCLTCTHLLMGDLQASIIVLYVNTTTTLHDNLVTNLYIRDCVTRKVDITVPPGDA